jgi:hypothetical protein
LNQLKKIIVYAAAGLFCICSISAQKRISEVLPDIGNEYEEMMKGSVVSADNSGGKDITKLTPEGSRIKKRIAAAPSGAAGFAVASVSFIPYPQNWKDMDSSSRMLLLYDMLGRISTQKGITYISRRAGYKPKVLFSESYYIHSPDDTKNILPDPVPSVIPESEVRYVYQKDTSFDGNVYRGTYTNTSNELYFEVTNCTAMKYHGITCLKKNELAMCFSVYPAEEGIIVNSGAIVTGHKTHVKIFFMDVNLSDSFKRRTEALHTWYRNQVER